MPLLVDLECSECSHIREVLCNGELEETDRKCPKCGCRAFSKLLGGVITKMHDPEVRNAALKKRSHDHSRKTLKSNLDRMVAEKRIPGLK